MKKIIALTLVMLCSFTVFAQSETSTIKKANNLIESKKYASAFKLLQDSDPKNENPDIVLLKENIALNYFVTSMMHEMFAFKDLAKNEDIMDYRGKKGSFDMYYFPIDSILNKLIKVYPDNYKLYKGLGDFYYEVQQKYGGQWLIDDKKMTNLILKNYQVAIDHNLADDKVYYIMGYQYLLKEKYKDAIPYFLKSIALKNDFADAQYNLAYAYLYTDDRVNAIKYAKNSLGLYKDADLKSDAARMIGEIYSELKDNKNATMYYELANKIDPNNYYNLKSLLDLYVETNNPKKNKMMNEFFNLAPENPTIYNNLGTIFIQYKKTNELIEFYKSKLLANKDNKKIYGSLNFYLGQLYLDSDKKLAKDYFLKAKSIFSTLYDKKNQVFEAINEGLKKAEK